ncbi:MAG: beta-lactamase family protein [Bacteroidetes bacterium]|nr:beta-lactamase family protein [Bacteroidota bacterium]
MKNFSLTALFLFIAQTSLFTDEQPDKLTVLKQDLTEFIRKEMKGKATGLSIALVDNQEIIWSEGFGYADAQNQIKATPETVYRVGSVSKLFTATSIMQLKERNQLHLDSALQTYIPEFSIKSRFSSTQAVTPRLLLTHHSGLPSDIMHNFMSKQPEPASAIIGYLKKEYLAAPPGQIFSYSNAGYSLLGVLTERLSKEDFSAYTQKNIFEPLEMKHSSFKMNDQIKPLFSKGYKGSKEFDEPHFRDVAAGQLYSNVLDLANFMKMTFNNGKYNSHQIISAASLLEMQTKQNTGASLDLNFSIGLCWFLNSASWEYAGGNAEHAGDTFIYHSQFATLPKHKIGVIVLDNSSQGGGLVRIVADKILAKYLELKTGLKKPDTKIKTQPANVSTASKQGYYVLGGDLFKLQSKGSRLKTKQPMATVHFIAQNDSSFIPQARIFGLIPINIPNQYLGFKRINGQDYVFAYSQVRDSMIIGKRLAPYTIPEKWKQACGDYVQTNDSLKNSLFKSYKLFIRDGFLMITIEDINGSKGNNVLEPVNDTEAIAGGVGRNAGQTFFLTDEGIYYQGMILKKMPQK